APAKAGDILAAVNEGHFSLDRIAASLTDLAMERHPGRKSDEEITLFKSVGNARGDLAGAVLVYRKAAEARRGRRAPVPGSLPSTLRPHAVPPRGPLSVLPRCDRSDPDHPAFPLLHRCRGRRRIDRGPVTPFALRAVERLVRLFQKPEQRYARPTIHGNADAGGRPHQRQGSIPATCERLPNAFRDAVGFRRAGVRQKGGEFLPTVAAKQVVSSQGRPRDPGKGAEHLVA